LRVPPSLATTDVIALRRELHAHPELGYQEIRTTGLIVDWLHASGLQPRVLPRGTGVICDIGAGGPMIALRADIDALPLQDEKDVPYRSLVDGVCHACGHDAHTAILLGAARELAARELPGRIRLVFQPAEETLPGGALTVLDADGLGEAAQIFALHCDPRLETGRVGLRAGPITAACDQVEIRLSGPGGHTARPQLTVDLIYALGLVITGLPGLLSRRVDPRAALSLVWGAAQGGMAANAIPTSASVRGTVRVFDRDAWDGAEKLIRELVTQVGLPTGAHVETSYDRGVPPVINDAGAVAVQHAAAEAALGAESVSPTPQSMGGEDFAWYLDRVPGALARLGVAAPGHAPFDLHQGSFDIDEAALDVGVRFTVELAITSLDRLAADALPL
jgi:amidohydrolase